MAICLRTSDLVSPNEEPKQHIQMQFPVSGQHHMEWVVFLSSGSEREQGKGFVPSMAFHTPPKEILIYPESEVIAPIELASELETAHCLPLHCHVTNYDSKSIDGI